tara:strand:- start:1023 stop:1211 length:189 start_codon:yes stop_codon:yes gene_type:complete
MTMIDKLNNVTRNLKYVLEEVQKKERSFEDMDITLRLHLAIRDLDEFKVIIYSALKKRGNYI